MTKNEIRNAMKERLSAMTPREYSGWNAMIHQFFWNLNRIQQANSIMIYYSIGMEPETVSIIQQLLEMGKTVSLPVCTPARNLLAGLIEEVAQLVTTRMGLKEPDPCQLQSPRNIDLIVVPGLAFDGRGCRLGRGGGYYDRFLSGQPNAFKLGLAYDFQVFSRIPAEPHDVRVNGLVTPSGYKEF